MVFCIFGAGDDAGQFLPRAALARFRLRGAAVFRSPLRFPQFAFAQQRLHPREILLGFPQFLQTFRLPGGKLKAQAENLLAQLAFLRFELVLGSCCGIFRCGSPHVLPLQFLRP